MERLLELLFPSPCIYCGNMNDKKKYGFCPECLQSLPLYLKKTENTWYIFEYDKKIASVLKRAKYAGRPFAVKKLAKMAGEMLKNEKITPDAVVFVPMFRKDLAKRGYNQSRIAASEIARLLKCPCLERGLIKIAKNKKQAGLTRMQREKNVMGVYKSNMCGISGKKILLVDDIMTTGSTLNECKKELKKAGASGVEAVVIAYTPFRKRD